MNILDNLINFVCRFPLINLLFKRLNQFYSDCLCDYCQIIKILIQTLCCKLDLLFKFRTISVHQQEGQPYHIIFNSMNHKILLKDDLNPFIQRFFFILSTPIHYTLYSQICPKFQIPTMSNLQLCFYLLVSYFRQCFFICTIRNRKSRDDIRINKTQLLFGQKFIDDSQNSLFWIFSRKLLNQTEKFREELSNYNLVVTNNKRLFMRYQQLLKRRKFSPYDRLLNDLEECFLLTQILIPNLQLLYQGQLILDDKLFELPIGNNSGKLFRKIKLQLLIDICQQNGELIRIMSSISNERMFIDPFNKLFFSQQSNYLKLMFLTEFLHVDVYKYFKLPNKGEYKLSLLSCNIRELVLQYFFFIIANELLDFALRRKQISFVHIQFRDYFFNQNLGILDVLLNLFEFIIYLDEHLQVFIHKLYNLLASFILQLLQLLHFPFQNQEINFRLNICAWS